MAKYLKLLPFLIALALLAGVPPAVSGQTPPSVSFSPTSYTVNEGDGIVEITVTMSGSLNSSVSIGLESTNAEARSGYDYRNVPTAVIFPANSTSQTFSITIVDDRSVEPSAETFSVGLQPSTDARITVDTTPAVVTIIDEDTSIGWKAVDRDSLVVQEGGTFQRCVVLEGVSRNQLVVSISHQDSDSALASGHTVPSAVTFNTGDTENCFTVTTGDVTDVSIVSFELTGTSADDNVYIDLGRRRYTSVRVHDVNSSVSFVEIERSSYTVAEGDGTVTITVNISPARSHVVSVYFRTADGTATAGSDYRHVATTVQFPANTASQTVDVTIVDTITLESSPEYFTVNLEDRSEDPRIFVLSSPTTISITDNDSAKVVVDRTSYIISEHSSSITVCWTISEPTTSCPVDFPFTVRLLTEDGTAVSPADYTALDATLPFSSCDRRRCVRIPIVNDSIVEYPEAFTVRLERTDSLPESITFDQDRDVATVEIRDDDVTTVRFENLSHSAEEDTGTVQIVMELVSPGSSCPSEVPVSLGIETSDATAESSLDYVAVDTTVTFAPCESRRTVDIPLIDDGRLENHETFTVRLLRTESSDPRIRIDSSTAVVEIADTGADTALLGFESEEYTVNEGDPLDLAVNLSGDATCPVEFAFDVSLGSAIPRGARSAIPKPASRVVFKSCELRRDLPIDTSDMEATAELRFELERTSRLDSRISIGQATAAAYVVDQGGVTEAFEGLAADENNSPWGIWSDGQTAWISNENDHKIYAYDLGAKERDSDQDFDTLDAADNDRPTGVWSNGTTMWVADYDDGQIYAYQMSDRARTPGEDFNTLSSAGNTNPTGIWSDETTMWVADYEDGKIYAYNLSDKARDATKGFNALATGNERPEGIWSNGQTMWVANSHTSTGGIKIYAYDMATRDRVEEKEFNSLIAAGQRDPKGIWSDGNIMWVVDKLNHKIYAYYFPAKPEVPVTVRRPSTTTTLGSPEIEETDPARPSTISAQCVSGEADEDAVDIELGITIADSWASGCPSVSRGGRLAKYYSFNLPITTAVEIALDSHLDDYLVLRRGGLSGDIVAKDDDSGPGNNSLISRTLTAGKYFIEATTFYADGVEADFTLFVKALPRILYEGPVSDVSRAAYGPAGPTMTVRLLPTRPMGTLEITIEDPDGFGEGAGPLGGAHVSGGSAGTVLLALPKTAWIEYSGIGVEIREAGAWSAHTQADEQAMLTRRSAGPDLSPVLFGLVQLIGKVEGALQLLQSLAGLSSFATDTSLAEPDESVLDTIFRKSYANCVSQVTVPWLVDAAVTTGVRISIPATLADTDYLSLAASFRASGNEPALTQLHDLLATGSDAPTCQRPERSVE